MEYHSIASRLRQFLMEALLAMGIMTLTQDKVSVQEKKID